MSIQLPKGFRFAGVHSGVKQNANKEDLSLVTCPDGATAAGVYTTNLVRAAPVDFDRSRTPSSDIRAVVVNSGNANACTGEQGERDAAEMARLTCQACGFPSDTTLVMSTGIIGAPLPMPKIAAGIQTAAGQLAEGEDAFLAAARGIITTDKATKTASRQFEIHGATIKLAGMAKGAGMIGPKMATMLGVILTDAAIAADDAQTALAAAVRETFNCISVEGHTSTNDTVLLLGSGKATDTTLAGDDLATFTERLTDICLELARAIPADGEGATHLITVEVAGCATRDDAFIIAKTIADSPLVKTAVTGNDPNWGRIVSAAGYAGVDFDPEKIDLRINGFELYRQGAPVEFDVEAASDSMRENPETHVLLTLGEGDAAVRFYTSDLTIEYIHINADYHT
jgi:glutamate N-acetyltransferase/amino-acid N-acetyltransferase